MIFNFFLINIESRFILSEGVLNVVAEFSLLGIESRSEI
jgi:hypothetical protein